MNSFRNRYILRLSLVLTAMLSTATAMAQDETPTGVVVKGSVYGGGNQADVKINSTVNMSAGQVEGNVYGGGNLGDVGNITKNTTDYNYSWKQTDGSTANVAEYNNNATATNTGICTVTISGGTIGQGTVDEHHGNVFGGGKGEANTFWCEKGIVYATSVSISAGTVNGSVYGGGEVGRVEDDTKVIIGEGTSEPTIKGNVFGAGAGKKTHGYSALVRGNSVVVVQGGAKVEQNVYGGGMVATVGKFWVTGVDYPAALNAPKAPTDLPDGMPYAWRAGGVCRVTVKGSAEITGDVFGAGKGQDPDEFPTHFESMTDPNDPQKTIKVEYYTTKEASEVGDIDTRMPKRMVNYEAYNETTKKGFKDTDKNITWVPYAYDDEDNPTIVWEYFDTPEKYHTFLQTLAIVDKPFIVINESAEVNGSVFGGSESGFVLDETSVSIQGGTIGTTTSGGDVFGGGKGLLSFAEAGRVRKNTNLTITNGAILGNVYGGGSLGDVGTITKPADYNYIWKQNDGTTGNVAEYNVPSSSTHDTDNNTGICTVYISGGTIGAQGKSTENHASGHVFGAGKGSKETWWCEKAIAYATNVSISGASTVVYGNVYGGGQVGRVEDDAKVVIGEASAEGSTPAPDIKGDVFGAGAGLETHGYSALVRGNALVTVQGTAQVGGSVYGGGEIASVGKFVVVGGLPTKPSTGGTCIVNIKDNAKIGTSGTTHNVFGACKGVTPHYNSSSYTDVYSMQTYENRPSNTPGDTWDYWKTYEEGYEGQKFIKRYYKSETEYLDFLKTLALTSNPHVTIGGTWTKDGTTESIAASGSPSVYGSVYGGGQRGVTLGAVDVNMVGGTVEQDVYGGGALADTNLGNWDVNHYVEATAQNEGESITDLYIITGGTGTTADPYKYTKVTDGNATFSPGTYYRRVPTWAHDEEDAYYKTTVDLTGGTIKGDAYGGALGNSTIAANVYGEVKINLNENVSSSSRGCIVNRIFGANNTNGSPMGNVTVHVFATQNKDVANKTTVSAKYVSDNVIDEALENANASVGALKAILADQIAVAKEINVTTTAYETLYANESATVAQLKENIPLLTKAIDEEANTEAKKSTINALRYDVQAVYGGGNQAAYNPVTPNSSTTSTPDGSQTKVIIEGCDVTSIETVYGGGNAAAVPETNVEIKAAYEILNVFGGGNGKDAPAPGVENLGADVGTLDYGETTYGTGNANSILEGGYIHEAYGGSNQKGIIKGSINQTSDPEASDCELVMSKVVGAGKYADIDGDVNMILACQPEKKIDLLFAGADEANVNGNITLTVTNGYFGKVFGGNNLGGAVKGKIVVNVEETGCRPIRIDELYLGGNEAAYSVYGYYESDEVHPVTGKKILKPRDSAADEHTPVSNPAADATHTFPYAQPELNIISCTYIGKVFGGGYGTGAALYGNPTVNINMIQGSHANTSVPAKMTELNLPNTENTDHLGIIGNVYGGGNAADVIGNPTVNVCTASTVEMTSLPKVNSTTEFEEDGVTPKKIYQTSQVVGAYIIGNVYGGGKGEADNFLCDKAMIGKNNDGIANPTGGTTVNIYNGFVRGNVYGGGEIGRVEKNTNVTIGTGDGVAMGTPDSAPIIMGSVYGGGAGEEEHGYAALVRGNPTVIIQGNAKVRHSVYGGGEIASVARYKVPQTEKDVEDAIAEGYTEAVLGMPYALKDESSGTCTVTVRGYAEIGPAEAMQMTKAGGPDDTGYVFGAGKGILPGGEYEFASGTTRRMVLYDATVHTTVGQEGSKWQWVDPDHKNVWEYFEDLDEYIKFIQTLALSSRTYVTITDNAFVKGSVYGGSENGIVQFNTDVKIQGGQIGAGTGVNRRYTDDEWASESLAECASWTFQSPYAPYDPYATTPYDGKYYYDSNHTQEAAGGAMVATDGHTYYGNVFGGGSGSVPYFDHTLGRSVYLHSAGQVKGNTNVTISGGHILTNVYGGNEATNVDGTANVTMTGGTVGVPRTDEDIIAHPLTGYIFGGGKGDQRVFFNKDTNVENAAVTVEGGRIYGSVYGGGEDGHVLKNVTMKIGKTGTTGPTIGTKGTSYYDGNVFGGGRGFGGEALTAGNVGGTVTLDIESGEILGSVYGGGRLASVGYGLYLTTETGFGENQNDGYGVMQEDGYSDWTKGTNNQYTRTAISGFKRGYITVNVKGGTIGNDVANAQYGGHVFGGSMGRLTKLDGSAFSDSHWSLLATAKQTTVNVTGGIIKRSVFGGGEMGTVTQNTYVTASGGTIGTTGKGGAEFGNVYGGGKGYVDPAGSNYITAGVIKGNTNVTIQNGTSTTPTIYHNIYGGGAYGSVGTFDLSTDANKGTYHVPYAGMPVNWTANTGTANVTITGGTIGSNGNENGMVFGSSRGDVATPVAPSQGATPVDPNDKLAWVNNTNVVIGTNGGNTSTPLIKGTVYGSGENGHTYSNAEVTVYSGTIGIETGNDITYTEDGQSVTKGGAAYPYRGNVYGGGCGTDKYDSDNDGVKDSYNPLAGIVLGNATVNISGGHVVRNVYGAGAMGSVGKVVSTTTNGVTTTTTTGGLTTINISGGTIGVDGMVGDGNVFGAARGDKEAKGNEVANHATLRLANVKTTTVKVDNGTIKGNVYGGGEVGSVGTYRVSTEGDDYMKIYTFESGTGICNVTINGGVIGTGVGMSDDGTFANGNVYGASKGLANTFWCEKGMVYKTNVTINAGTVKGTVYGGGQIGRVENDATVTIGESSPSGTTSAPTIEGNVFGAGAGQETHGYSALLRGDTEVTVQGNASVGLNVYGGGEKASVGRFVVVKGLPTEPANDGSGDCTVNVQGNAVIAGSVFGTGQGVTPHYYTNVDSYTDTDDMPKRMMAITMGKFDSSNSSDWEYVSADDPNNVWEYLKNKQKYLDFLPTLALASHPVVTIGGNATVNGSVYGGGQRGITMGTVEVDIVSGTVKQDVYGGGALADTNKGNWDASTSTWATGKSSATFTTTVNLKGGNVNRDVYGGGLGQKEGVNGGTSDVEALVYGDVTVKLNETTASDNCVVKGNIFGCKNVNGTPKGDVTVHVYKTVGWTETKEVTDETGTHTVTVDHDVSDGKNDDEISKGTGVFELAAVYGGGNQASYVPVDPNNNLSTEVIIDGCALTSIKTVYGGGNAASVPGTHVTVNSCYEIGTVFGGGNGKGDNNPGANVGYMPEADGKTSYGSGRALVDLLGGTVNESFGGSNTLGDVRVSATVDMHEDAVVSGSCPLNLDVVYGAGNESEQTGDSKICLTCITKLNEVYAGANKADVKGNVEMTIQSGQYNRVFGGNNESGEIKGNITVNIEETGCYPIIIGQLYGAGNMAKYADGRNNGKVIVNAKSFTSIGEIYGGGYGSGATVNGETYVYVNEFVGDHASEGMKTEEGHTDESLHTGETRTLPNGYEVEMPMHKSGAIGAVGTIYGGGNAATVNGNTHVYIGTKTEEFQAKNIAVGESVIGYYTLNDNAEGTSSSDYTLKESGSAEAGKTYYEKKTVIGADIRGNVYGGGNAAVVTGNTNVVIGKEPPVTTSGNTGGGSGSGSGESGGGESGGSESGGGGESGEPGGGG